MDGGRGEVGVEGGVGEGGRGGVHFNTCSL